MTLGLTNENLTIDVMRLGTSREPLLVIDGFSQDPDALVRAAMVAADWAEVAPGGYPGMRAGVPRSYVQHTLRRLDPIIRSRLLNDGPHKLDRFECAFSRVTRTPQALTPLQKLPHIDIARPSRVAILHYLCGPPHGGTAFFRQDRTGLEQVQPEDKMRYAGARAEDLAALDAGAGFSDGDTPGYTQIGAVEARFNRVAIYRSFTLHSGIITDATLRSGVEDDPGRLTANFFVDYVPGAAA